MASSSTTIRKKLLHFAIVASTAIAGWSHVRLSQHRQTGKSRQSRFCGGDVDRDGDDGDRSDVGELAAAVLKGSAEDRTSDIRDNPYCIY